MFPWKMVLPSASISFTQELPIVRIVTLPVPAGAAAVSAVFADAAAVVADAAAV